MSLIFFLLFDNLFFFLTLMHWWKARNIVIIHPAFLPRYIQNLSVLLITETKWDVDEHDWWLHITFDEWWILSMKVELISKKCCQFLKRLLKFLLGSKWNRQTRNQKSATLIRGDLSWLVNLTSKLREQGHWVHKFPFQSSQIEKKIKLCEIFWAYYFQLTIESNTVAALYWCLIFIVHSTKSNPLLIIIL